MVDYEPLKMLIPPRVFSELLEVSTRFVINSPLRMAHFLAQCAHESGNFKLVEENLNYSAERLLAVFPRYFDHSNVADYAHQPIEIASRVYADRMGNSSEDSLDGWTYRGRGFIQLTGKDNYKAFDYIAPEDILVCPDLVASRYPLLSAAWFWHSKNLNAIADRGAEDNWVAAITLKVNGGYHGLDNRSKFFDRYYNAIR